MSSSEFQAEEPPDVVETELDSWGAWVQTLASTTDAPRVSSVGAAVSPYVPKYPGLQEFSRRYADVHGYIAAVVCILGERCLRLLFKFIHLFAYQTMTLTVIKDKICSNPEHKQ